MSVRALGVAACLRRVSLSAAATRTSRVIHPTGFNAGRRYASVGAVAPEAEPTAAETKTGRKPSARALAKQLEFITDPWVLGKYIEDLLAKDKFDDALTTAELASKDLDTVVSWNHLIDYSLKQQQIKRAMTTYNNMKKRAQFPNAQTYTIIFRGLAKSNHPKIAVAEAVKLFNQLKNDRRLQPNTIHVNAVLTVCSHAYDLDQLLVVAGELEELGLAPTAATYGIILNGMRQYAWREYGDLDKDTKKLNVEKLVARGQQIWAEVLDKWRRGKLRLDEPLICTMGRLQLLATDLKEKLRVLDLIEQTMNVPNLLAAKGAAKSPPGTSSPEQPTSERRVSRNPRRPDAFVRPGPNTLALILTTLVIGRQPGAAPAYWNLLVHDGGLVPDDDNWLRMIGVLKLSHSSAQAAQILGALPASGVAVAARSFGIAMEACVRDNINPHVMTHATRILRIMRTHLAPESPDMHTMRLYLRTALVSHAAFRGRARAGDEVGAKAAYGRQIATALAELWHPYIDLYNKYFKSEAATSPTGDAGTLYNNQKEVIALGRMMVGAFAKVVEEKMLPGNDNRDMIIASAKINKGVTAFFGGRELREPRLNPKATATRDRDAAAAPSADGGESSGDGSSSSSSSSGSSGSGRSVFDIDMPALDDTIDQAGKRSLKRRHGGDFVWNTRRMETRPQRKRTGTESTADGNKSLIDRWVSPSIGNLQPAEKEDAPAEDFIPIKPVSQDVTTDAGAKSSGTRKATTTGDTDQSDQSLWATLMAQRR